MSNKIPYTEIIARIKSDINYIAEEAYRNGYDEARLIYQNPHAEADYQRGQEDMHRAIFQMIDMNSADRMDAFGMVNTYDIITNLSPSEFYAKLTAYEVKKKANERIVLGDGLVTKRGDMKGIALSNEVNGSVYAWREDCVTYEANVKEWKKTGETYPQAYELLKAMKDGEE